MVQKSHLCHCSCKFISQWNTVFLPCAYVSPTFLSFSSAFPSICVEKEEESKVHCQCKGFDMARQQFYSFWIRSMQVPPGFHRDLDRDCSPNVVAVRWGWYILGWDNIVSPVSIIHRHIESPVSFSRKWKNKIKSGENKKYSVELNSQWSGDVLHCFSPDHTSRPSCYLTVTTAEGLKVFSSFCTSPNIIKHTSLREW